MSGARLRHGFLLAGLVGLGLLLGWSLLNLHPYGEFHGPDEIRIEAIALHERHVTNLDAFVNFDLRALDTLGEEFIFFTAIVGLSLVLRRLPGEAEEGKSLPLAAGRSAPEPDELTRWITPAYVPALVVFGLYVLIHGHLTPGGGFQAGAIIGSALAMIYVAFGYSAFSHTVDQERTEVVEAAAAACYIATGLTALAIGASFLTNILPVGETGRLYSAGTIWILNDVSGAAVSFGFLTMMAEFISQTHHRGSGAGG
ncbi:MAG TPA: MnhB domain-containing protein [Acetobacteraceae bacterium]|nr:MnhB domain-containing protein [Acetobacteraceae bacterium]